MRLDNDALIVNLSCGIGSDLVSEKFRRIVEHNELCDSPSLADTARVYFRRLKCSSHYLIGPVRRFV